MRLPTILRGAACALALAAGGCALNALPVRTSARALDAGAVRFIRSVPRVAAADFADQRLRPGQRHPERTTVIAVSGGGARAAAFTLGVLAELEVLGAWTSRPVPGNALAEVDYFSTVSGGGWGVAAYLADRGLAPAGEAYHLNPRMGALTARFVSTAKRRGECLSRRLAGLTERDGRTLRLGDVLAPPGAAPSLPHQLVNAAVAGNESPFVFTERTAAHYRVESITFCTGEPVPLGPAGVRGLALSQAVAVSGSVPGFHHASARTGVCAEASDLRHGFFCRQGRAGMERLILVDGAVYDNHGHHTAMELLASLGATPRALVVIDADADTDVPFTADDTRRALGVMGEVGFRAGFPPRTTAYHRNAPLVAEALGYARVHLDFAVAAGLRDTLAPSGRSVLEGLPILRAFAEAEVRCVDAAGVFLPLPKRGSTFAHDDCRENNFYRAGLLAKTTYHVDERQFWRLVELGRLVVRLRADALADAIHGPAPAAR